MKTKRIEGGRLWKQSRINPDGWESGDGSFRIYSHRGNWMLISFEHFDQNDEYLTRMFPTVEAAMEYAEKM